MLALTANVLIRELLSPACVACEAGLQHPLAGPVCAACWQTIPALTPPGCVCCGEPLSAGRSPGPFCPRCERDPPAYVVARSAGRYDGSLRLIVHAFKYGRQRALAAPLGRLMRDAGGDLLAGADVVVPVPLHPWRALRRGFNQADDLAVTLGLPVWRILRRRRLGSPQSALPAARRLVNVQAAFCLARTSGWRADPSLRGAAVVLVDDVMTTGATLDACGRVLREAGVRRVAALTLARAATTPPPEWRPRPRPWTAPRR